MTVASAVGRGEIAWFVRRCDEPGFTARDRLELDRWMSGGCRTVVLDDDPSDYAMLYEGVTPWARWAVSRQDGRLVMWDCVTFADIGRFSSMVDALATISGSVPTMGEPACNVLPFVATQRNRRQARRA